MKIDLIMQDTCLSAISKLHYILMHTNDPQIQNECKNIINTLNEKVIFPAINYRCLMSKDGN